MCPRPSLSNIPGQSSRTKPGEEVSKVDKFAMGGILNIDNTPSVLSATDSLSINNHVGLGADNGKRNDVLKLVSINNVSRRKN
jgi:hypothetical protein